MTIRYCSWIAGDDSTGDGSPGNPYKSIDKATTGAVGGDECRCAKNAAPTALSGTLAWVDGSATVSTSVDLTGVLAAGNFVRAIGDVIPWEISSLNASAITLVAVFTGATQTVASEKINPIDTGAAAADTTPVQVCSVSGAAYGNELKISGGWDLSTELQTGETWFLQSGANRYGYGLYINNKNYVDVSKLGFLRYRYGVFGNSGNGHNYADIYSIGSGNYALNITAKIYSVNSVTNIVACGGGGGMVLVPAGGTFTGIKNYSCTYRIVTQGENGYFYNLIVNRCAAGGVYNTGAKNRFISPQFLNGSGYWAENGPGCQGSVYYNPSHTGYGDIYRVYQVYSEESVVGVQGQNGNAAVSVGITSNGYAARNTAEARSGSCLQFVPSRAALPMKLCVGVAKVTSTASNITLGVYLKKGATFNGAITAAIYHLGNRITGWTTWTPTTDYALNAIIANSGDLVQDEMLELWIRVTGTVGSVYLDDFYAS